jgi:hypothetical protein
MQLAGDLTESVLGKDEKELDAGCTASDRIPVKLAQQLGPSATILMTTILGGTSENKPLARLLQTSAASIRKRRARICRILVDFAKSREAGL